MRVNIRSIILFLKQSSTLYFLRFSTLLSSLLQGTLHLCDLVVLGAYADHLLLTCWQGVYHTEVRLSPTHQRVRGRCILLGKFTLSYSLGSVDCHWWGLLLIATGVWRTLELMQVEHADFTLYLWIVLFLGGLVDNLGLGDLRSLSQFSGPRHVVVELVQNQVFLILSPRCLGSWRFSTLDDIVDFVHKTISRMRGIVSKLKSSSCDYGLA